MYNEIQVIAHSCIRIAGDAIVYFDPFELTDAPHDADIVCITHSHYDHFSPDDLRRVLRAQSVLVLPESLREEKVVRDFLRENPISTIHYMKPLDTLEIGSVHLEALRAYNTNKDYHLPEYNWLGFVLTMTSTRYYIAGDTDATPENLSVVCDVALVPVGATYTFTAEEAADFIGKIRPKAAIPTHYGSVVGQREDGAHFVKLVQKRFPAIDAFERLRFDR